MKFELLLENILSDVEQANKTARSGAGAVGGKAITPRYVADTLKPGETILNFGAGVPDKVTGKYFHSELLRAKGGVVDEYDFGRNSTGALGRKYQTVFASNVLNVQSGPEMLSKTLNQIKDSVAPGGRVVFNFPTVPRYNTMSADEVATFITAVFKAEPMRVGGTRQAPLWEVKPAKSEVHPSLKTLKGSSIERHKRSVGKKVGPQIYVHKDYAGEVVPSDVLEKAKGILAKTNPDFEYNSIMYDTSNGTVRFDEAPDFDTAREPHVGDMVKVDKDGKVSTGHSDSIWHHKWLWVKEDYPGFDVNKSREWSRTWLNKVPEIAKGTDNSFMSQLKKYKVTDENIIP